MYKKSNFWEFMPPFCHFLNSLFREWSDYHYDLEAAAFTINLKNESTLIIPVTIFSLVGRHEYGDQFFLKKKNLFKSTP